MKSNRLHVFARPWSQLSAEMGQLLYRLERRNRWGAAVAHGFIAGSAVAVVAWLANTGQKGDLLLFACLGSSSAAIVFAPFAKTNSLRSILLAYTISALGCLALLPLHQAHLFPMAVECFLAVAVPTTLMRLADAMHPAAIGASLAFIIFDRDIQSIGLLLVTIMGLLSLVKVLAYLYLEDLRFKDFAREFHRDYFGHEVTVTVLPDEETSQPDKTSAPTAKSGVDAADESQGSESPPSAPTETAPSADDSSHDPL